jgi:transcriptional regulator NrdR family protein
MRCPVCQTWVQIKETRQKPDNSIYRRYECANTHRFVTTEQVARIIKPKGKHEGNVALQGDRPEPGQARPRGQPNA